MSEQTATPPGWYPVDDTTEGYWDGSAWSDQRRPKAPAIPPPPPPVAAVARETLTAKGHNGTVSFDGDFVTITRTGALARMTVGKGEKRIPVHTITGVQWKPPGALVNGFISFTVPGGNESRSRMGSQTTSAASDENAVIVTKSQAGEFQNLRSVIESEIAARGRR